MFRFGPSLMPGLLVIALSGIACDRVTPVVTGLSSGGGTPGPSRPPGHLDSRFGGHSGREAVSTSLGYRLKGSLDRNSTLISVSTGTLHRLNASPIVVEGGAGGSL